MDNSTAEKLKQVHPELRRRVELLLLNLNGLGIDVRAVQGLRTFAEQNALYAQGRTAPGKRVTNAPGGQSNHNFGFAVDLCPFVEKAGFKNKQPDWNDLAKFKIIGREAKKLGLEWGGDWKFVDMPHVQLRGMSVKECQAFYRTGALPAVWNRMNQILSGSKPTVFTPKEDDLLEFGDKGPEILHLQKRLAGLNLLRPHEIDGHFGRITKNAVIGFQRQNHLTADGIVGSVTRKLLLLDLRKEEIKLEIPFVENPKSSAAAPTLGNPPVSGEKSVPETPAAAGQPAIADPSGEQTANGTAADARYDNGGEFTEGTRPHQNAENITNVNLPGEAEKNTPPPDFKPEDKTVKAPLGARVKEKIDSWFFWLGIGTPSAAGVIASFRSYQETGILNWRGIGSVVFKVFMFTFPYLIYLLIAYIAYQLVKEVFKQISLLMVIWVNGRADMNNVTIQPSDKPVNHSPQPWWHRVLRL
jgi:peptidoglycan L-alanyl-D-glutamate endopeptidase CwlK